MNKYQKYKDSGVEWYDQIPEHWDKKKISFCFGQIGSGTTPTSGQSEYYEEGENNWLQTGDLNDAEIYKTSKKITDKALNTFSTLKVYPINSLVIAMYGATIGKMGMLKVETTTNQACCVLAKSNGVNEKFTFYWFLSVRDYIISLSYGGGQPNINQDIIRNLRLHIPSTNEQLQIVSFLDQKTSIIDDLIKKKLEKIELLKEQRTSIINNAVTKGLNADTRMKDSGIEWIGEIPEHWGKKKLGYLVNLQGRIGYKGYTKSDFVNEGEGCLVLGGKHINSFQKIDLSDPEYLNWDKYFESPEIMVHQGDLIISQRGTLGKVVFVEKNYGEMTINPSLVLLTQIKANPLYLWYYLQSDFILTQIKIIGSITTIPMLSQEELSSFQILVPPLSDQNQIVDYLDNKTSEIDKQVDLENRKIELLKEYRQSLISEVVTGKIDVRTN